MDMNYFNAEKTRDDIVKWLKDWFDKNGKTSKAVIGISGGKDSTIIAGLCVRALGKERVLGVLMPNGVQKDISDSVRVCDVLGIKNITVNIADAYADVKKGTEDALGMDASEQTLINIAPRLRMTTLYAISQTVGGRVVNTSNRSEAAVGYFTRWGDECGDVKPIINLTKSEVVEIGKTMTEIPIDLIVKSPSDGLTGMTDEEKIGFSYDNLDKYLTGQEVEDKDELDRIVKRMMDVEFKRCPIDAFKKEAIVR